MNLADYLSELLAQYEEVSVPGLGYFVRERVNGFYNEKEAKFYPPYHKVKFVPQLKDDDTFAQYVADKKNISLASSKYFAEKFVSKLKEQALTGKYLFADLGLFYTDQGQLAFKANDKIVDDPAFYGYPPVTFFKQGASINDLYSRPSFGDPAPVASPQKPIEPVVDEPYFEEEAERKKGLSIWLIILIAVTAVALALFGVYKFYPEAFDKISSTYDKLTGKTDTVVPIYRHEVKTDSTTLKQPVAVKDTPVKAVAPVSAVADTAKHSRFEIVASKFRQIGYANSSVLHLKAKGLEAKILTDAPGNMLKVSVGTFSTYEEAQTKMLELIKEGKISNKAELLEIKQ